MPAPYLLTSERVLQCANVGAFALAMVVNALGGSGKLTGTGVGTVSKMFDTPLTPANYAFSIWGAIYTCNALFVLLQLYPRSEQQRELYFDRIGWFHVLLCMANSAWIPIFCIGTKVSVALASMPLACMLLALAVIMHQAGLGHSQRDSAWDYVAVDLGFSLYVGWVTAATVLNLFLGSVALGFTGSPWTLSGWALVLACLLSIAAVVVTLAQRNWLYALPVAWAVFATGVANSGASYNNPTLAAVAKAAAAVVLAVGLLQLVLTYRTGLDVETTDSAAAGPHEEAQTGLLKTAGPAVSLV